MQACIRVVLLVCGQNRVQYSVMRIFGRKKPSVEHQRPGPRCSRCGSTNTGLIVYHGTDQPNYVRIWRGRRFLTYRCFDCGQDFYQKEPPGGAPDEVMTGSRLIDDEEALRRAEEELKKEGGRRWGSHMPVTIGVNISPDCSPSSPVCSHWTL